MAITATGTTLDATLAALGLNRAFAERLGTTLDATREDPAARQQRLYSMYAALSFGGDGAPNGSAVPPSGYVPRPADFLTAPAATGDGGEAAPPTGQGFGGLSGDAPFGNSPWARSLQVAMLRNPEFRGALEKMLGGQVLPDGRMDHKLGVWRGAPNRLGGIVRPAVQQGALQATGFAGVLSGLNVPLNGVGQSPILRGLQSMEANLVSTVKSFAGGDAGLQAMAQKLGINPQTAGFEDVVFLGLMNYGGNKEKEIMGKVNSLSGYQAQAQVAGTAAAPPLQPFGGLAGGAGGTTAAQLGLLATPAQDRPTLGAAQLQRQAAGGAAAGTVFDAQGNVVGKPEDMSETMRQQLLQKMMGDLQKMYEMLSNMIKSMHDMQMTPIRNLRG